MTDMSVTGIRSPKVYNKMRKWFILTQFHFLSMKQWCGSVKQFQGMGQCAYPKVSRRAGFFISQMTDESVLATELLEFILYPIGG
jgi:hypothetical protein